MLIYCEKCGAPYNEYFFCERCGHMLDEDSFKNKNAENNRLKSAKDRGTAYDKIVRSEIQDPKTDTGTIILIVTLSVALILLLILTVYLFQR